MVRARFCLGLFLSLMVYSGCERSEVRSARQALRLVHTMVVEIQATSAQASDRFSRRPDFEDLRRAFGGERFDAGTPLGPDFQRNLAALMTDLEGQLEKEPKDGEFLRKALRRVRKFQQWWTFARQELETRRDKLVQARQGQPAQQLLGGRVSEEDMLGILAETFSVIGAFEASTFRCIRGIEELLTRS